MRWIFALIIFALLTPLANAQNEAAMQQAESACGPTNVKLDVETKANPQMPEPASANSAQVFVIEDFLKPVDTHLVTPTIRVGADGSWVGAGRGNSYLSFAVTPGKHHLCVDWQSKLKRFSRLVSFSGLDTEDGQTYYFRARVEIPPGTGGPYTLDLEPINTDEAKFLMSRYPLATLKK